MEIYESEHEQVEALKAWWDKYGTRVIVALVVLLAAVLGGRYWIEHTHRQAEEASAQYMSMLQFVQSKPDQAMAIGRQLVSHYPNSSYAAMASLSLAAVSLEKGDKESAAANLRWVMEKGKQPELKQLARLRLGRLLLDMGKADEALALLDKGDKGSFTAAFDELRGDILLSQGKRAEARTAYANALAGYNDAPGKQSILQMKIDDLADAKSGTS